MKLENLTGFAGLVHKGIIALNGEVCNPCLNCQAEGRPEKKMRLFGALFFWAMV
jgi:hypothetical protein